MSVERLDTLTTDQAGGMAERPRGVRAVTRVLQVAIGIAALALVISKADGAALAGALRATRISFLPLAVLASVTVTWLMAVRWKLVLEVRCQRLSVWRLFAYYLVGIFFGNCVPGGSVSLDVARLIYAGREIHDRAFVMSTLVFERVVGLFVVLITGLAATLAARAYLPEHRAVYAVEAILAGVLVAAALLMSRRITGRLARAANSAGARLNLQRPAVALARFLEAIGEMKSYPRMVTGAIALSFVIRGVWSMGCYVIALAMGLPVELPLVFAFIAIYDLIRMLPITIGGLGIREWVLVALFAKVGVGREEALMFAFLAFMPILVNAIAGGLIYIGWASRGSRAGSGKQSRIATPSERQLEPNQESE
jgi:uncharacterized protein (TIRG00374 family)